MVVENSFGILSARWRIFGTSIMGDLEIVKLITHTCCILHNFLLSCNDFHHITLDMEINGQIVEGSWRETTRGDSGMVNLNRQGSNNAKMQAHVIRDSFKDYFNSDAGRVAWQNSKI